MNIIELLLWVGVGIIVYRMFIKPSASQKNNEAEEDRHLTTTQRKWREMKREQELEKLVSDSNDYTAKYEQVLKLQIEMQQYIHDNKRRFHPLIWIFDIIDPRLCGEYIRHLAIVFCVFLFFAFFGGWSSMLTVMLVLNVVTVDFLVYRKQLMLEVTEWNPEFQEKFTKKFKNITKDMNIP